VFFLLDPGPCQYYPWFFTLYDDIKHPKYHQFSWLEMALEALAAAAMAILQLSWLQRYQQWLKGRPAVLAAVTVMDSGNAAMVA
jgi:hypothetical protein